MNNSIYISVSDLNRLIKDKFDSDPSLNDVFLKGELSNVKLYSSGHLYFSIKDKDSVIKGVMWASYINRLTFTPKDGDEVILHGKVSVYPARGEYQIYVDMMAISGAGDELKKLKELTEKLKNEGLFDESRKRELPKFPLTVGLITANNSAAIEDMKVNLLNRWPLTQIKVFPSLVQGKDAPKDLIKSLTKAYEASLDVLIIGRGGGSSEDLSAFNDEELVRMLSKSPCPVISAVGHEIDVSLTDLVADKRVSTPTGAAIAAVPDKNEVYSTIDYIYDQISSNIEGSIFILKEKLKTLVQNRFLTKPSTIYEDKINKVNECSKLLKQLVTNYIDVSKEKVNGIEKRLNALSPSNVLNRGYSMTTNENGEVISSINQIANKSLIRTLMKDGIIISEVQEKESN